jgi:uncharacterized protein (TIGR03083 family)
VPVTATTFLDPAQLDRALLEQSRLLGELTRTADLDVPVPTCPEWTLRQLVTHVGRGDRWAATIVETRADEPVDPRTVSDGRPPSEPGAVAEWLVAGAQRVADAVAGAPADTTVWTFAGPQPARWWVRRRVHEAAVHRADAAIALGVGFEVPPELAADGVSEWLSLLAARPASEPPLEGSATLHLHALDGGLGEAGEWIVRSDGAGVAWEHGHAKATVAVRAAAADLLLAVLRRIPPDDARLQVFGEAAVLARWLDRTRF